MQNNLRVMIAAADTFRAGAVEQLRTHVQKLQYIFKNSTDDHLAQHADVALHERGYGKDAASIAASGITRGNKFVFE